MRLLCAVETATAPHGDKITVICCAPLQFRDGAYQCPVHEGTATEAIFIDVLADGHFQQGLADPHARQQLEPELLAVGST